jgi:general secretion pathway protein I
MNAMTSARAQRGYTLLEVLIAFTLLAIGLGLLLAILSDGLRSVANASDSTRATLYAESMLDALGADRRLQPGRSAGAFENNKYRWTLDIATFQPPDAAPPPNGPNHVDLLLQMKWGTAPGQNLRVETLRAYAPPPPGLQQ